MTAKGVNGAHVNGAHAGDRPKKYRRPELYTNREIALVDFSRRVFEEAQNPRHPLLERVKFLAFVGSQLDEFLMVRVAGLYDQIEAQVTEAGPDGIPPRQLLEQVNQRVKALLNEARRYFEHELLPQLTLTGMYSLDPALVGADGYHELFQAGEVFEGRPLVDRQHPHDLFMQLAASWRFELSSSTSLTLTGAPVGAPALGPIPYMHRASSFDNPITPLTHHLFDSTHISFGVATASIEHGPWTLQGSVFNGREPDEHRWDFDFGRMDSVSARLWFKPTSEWAIQVSTGHLVSPEALVPGDIERTTVTASWTRVSGSDLASVTAGYGRNGATTFDLPRNGAFVEGSRHAGRYSMYGRIEVLQLDHAIADVSIGAFTVGGVRDILNVHGLEGGVGAGLTLYATPSLLTPSYGAHPVSWQVFFRLRASKHMVNMQ